MKLLQRKPQWDDWRCYRCNQWQTATTGRAMHLTPSGLSLAVCSTCLVREHTEDGHPLLDRAGCPVCEWMLAQHAQTEVPA